MIIFHNCIKKNSEEGENGDELGSDSFPYTVVDGVCYKFKLRRRTDTVGGDFDIGANESQEEAAEECESAEMCGLDICLNHHLVTTPMPTSKHLRAYIKSFAALLKPIMAEKYGAEEAKARLGKLSKVYKEIMDDFDNLEFYTGEHFNSDGTILIVRWDGETPYGYLPIDGVIEEKQ